MLAQPGWAIAIVLIGVAILIFPDGRPVSPLLRRVLWLYLAPAVVWMGSAYVLTADVIVRHAIRVDSGGNLVTLDNGPSSPAWQAGVCVVTRWGWSFSHGQCHRVEDAMAVYVNKLRGQDRLLLGGSAPPFSGPTADTEDELHAFAARLGVRGDPDTPAGSQQEPVTRHYTLTESERDRAVELGAQVITAREADKTERQRAAMRGGGESRF